MCSEDLSRYKGYPDFASTQNLKIGILALCLAIKLEDVVKSKMGIAQNVEEGGETPVNDEMKTKEQLLDELTTMRQDMVEMHQRIAELEELVLGYKRTEEALTRLMMLMGTYEVKVVLHQAVKSAVEIARTADRGSLQLLDQNGKILRTVAISDASEKLTDVIPFQPGVGIAGHALVSGQIINVPDVLLDRRFVSSKLPLRFRSLLVAPLIIKGLRLGTLSLSSEQVDAFSLTDELLIKLVADQTAVALENAQLFAPLRTRHLIRRTEA